MAGIADFSRDHNHMKTSSGLKTGSLISSSITKPSSHEINQQRRLLDFALET